MRACLTFGPDRTMPQRTSRSLWCMGVRLAFELLRLPQHIAVVGHVIADQDKEYAQRQRVLIERAERSGRRSSRPGGAGCRCAVGQNQQAIEHSPEKQRR